MTSGPQRIITRTVTALAALVFAVSGAMAFSSAASASTTVCVDGSVRDSCVEYGLTNYYDTIPSENGGCNYGYFCAWPYPNSNSGSHYNGFGVGWDGYDQSWAWTPEAMSNVPDGYVLNNNAEFFANRGNSYNIRMYTGEWYGGSDRCMSRGTTLNANTGTWSDSISSHQWTSSSC